MRAIIIGAGISGLACAYRLQQSGVPVLLFERDPRVGGLIESLEHEGFLVELGPQSFSSTDLLLAIIEELGLSAQLLRANPRAPRYVLAEGRLHPVPLTPPALLTSSLLGFRAKWRLVHDALGNSRPPDADESVAQFVRRKFSAELLDNLVGPFVSGVYAGDAEKLSLRSAFPAVYAWERDFGSVLRGALKSRPPKNRARQPLCSFHNGMVTLVRALGARLRDSVRCGVTVESIRRATAHEKPPFELQINSADGNDVVTADAVIVATPPHVAGQLLSPIAAALATHFARIESAPVAVVALGYRREQIGERTDGFGFLVSQKEKRRLLGTVWNSSLFPGRAPQGMVLLTSFAGGATDRELCEMREESLAEGVVAELAQILKITGPPVTRWIQRYPAALPQYNLGHAANLAALRQLCAGVPGLFLAGNYLEGPSLGACVELAFRIADAAQQHLAASAQGPPDRGARAKSLSGGK